MNKMFKKILAVAAVAATAACMSVSAFAADVTVAPENASVSVNAATVENATQYTVMVFKTTADITNADAVKAATPADVTDIYYINQGDNVATLVKDMLVKATTVKNEDGTETTTYLPTGNYIARVGNDKGSVQNFTLESKVAEEDDSNSITVYWGDVTGDGAISGADVSAVKMKAINIVESAKVVKDITENSEKSLTLNMGDKVKLTIGDTTVVFYWGDVTGDGAISGADVSAVKMKAINIVESAKVIKDVTEDSSLSVSVNMGDAVTISPYTE